MARKFRTKNRRTPARKKEGFAKKVKRKIFHVTPCYDSDFYGIDILEMEDKYGFEGYYMGDINHPDYNLHIKFGLIKKMQKN